jgi:hypothetical protein
MQDGSLQVRAICWKQHSGGGGCQRLPLLLAAAAMLCPLGLTHISYKRLQASAQKMHIDSSACILSTYNSHTFALLRHAISKAIG